MFLRTGISKAFWFGVDISYCCCSPTRDDSRQGSHIELHFSHCITGIFFTNNNIFRVMCLGIQHHMTTYSARVVAFPGKIICV